MKDFLTDEEMNSFSGGATTVSGGGFSPDFLSDEEMAALENPSDIGFTTPKKEGFGTSLAKGFAQPFAKLAISAGEAIPQVNLPFGYSVGGGLNKSGEILKGDYEKRGKDVNINSVKEGVGTAGEAFLNVFGGEAVGKAGAKTLLNVGKGIIPKSKAIIPLAGSGAALGGGTAASQSIQEDKTVGQNVRDTAVGAITGAILNPALQVGLPALTGTVAKKVKGKIQKVLDPQKNIDELEATYDALLSGQSPSKARKYKKAQDVTQMKNKAGTEGRPPQRVLAEYGIIPEQEGANLRTLNQAEALRGQTEKLKAANRQAIAEVDTVVPPTKLDEIERDAIANIKVGTPEQKEQMVQKIRRNMAATRRQNPNGVTLSKQDELKSAHWGATKFDTAVPQLDRDVNYALAKAYQKNIEKVAKQQGFEDVSQLNREIGDILESANFLEGLNGKVVKGGRLQGYVFQMIGSQAGSTVLGKILGAMGGDVVANILISNKISGPVKRRVLAKLQVDDPAVYGKVISWLEKNKKTGGLRLALPEGKPGMRSEVGSGRTINVMPTVQNEAMAQSVKMTDSVPQTRMGQPTPNVPPTEPAARVLELPAGPNRLALPPQSPLGTSGNPILAGGGTPIDEANIVKKGVTKDQVQSPRIIDIKTKETPTLQMSKPDIAKKTKKEIPARAKELLDEAKEHFRIAKKNKGNDFEKQNVAAHLAAGAAKKEFANEIINKKGKFAIAGLGIAGLASQASAAEKPITYGELAKTREEGREINLKAMNTPKVQERDVVAKSMKSLDYAPEKIDPVKVAKVIKSIETDILKEPYSFRQPSGDKALGDALGAYQITEGLLKRYGKDYLGKEVTTEQFLKSPQLQDKFMEKEIERWDKEKDGKLSPQMAMAIHRRGWKGAREKFDGNVGDTRSYVEKGLKRYYKTEQLAQK